MSTKVAPELVATLRVTRSMTHDRLPTAEDRETHSHGWNGCLEKLDALF